MIITIKNVALEPILQEYNVRDINELSDDDLHSICRKLNVQEAWIMDKNIANRRLGLDRLKVLAAINAHVTFDDYMGSQFLDLEHDELDRKYRVRESLGEVEDGKQTFKIMESAGMGFLRLAPGESRKLNVSRAWLEEYFLKAPSTTARANEAPRILVYNEKGECLNGTSTVTTPEEVISKGDQEYKEGKNDQITTSGLAKEVDLKTMPWNLLQKLAKGYDIKQKGMGREDLIAAIKDAMARDPQPLNKPDYK